MSKKIWPIILVLASVKLIIQCLGNRNYGFHRDELLHLSVSEHLDWGFMEFPPFIAFLGKMSYLLFDYSIMGVRLFPTMAGIAILILCCKMAIELGGKTNAVLLSGICILAFLPFYRNHTLFQPVAFDQLFWTAGFYLMIKFIKTEKKDYLLYTGMTLGIGLLNKYTMIIWAFGMFIGLLIYKRPHFKNRWLYISGLLAMLIFLPNVLWQVSNDLPFIQHLRRLEETQLGLQGFWDFGLAQLEYPLTLAIGMIGTWAFLGGPLKQFKTIGVSAIVIFVTMWLLRSKGYYVFAIYPVLFAAGSVIIEYWLRERERYVYLIGAVLLFSTAMFVPHATPILKIDDYVSYADLESKDGRIELQGDYADMFGWEEQVAIVDSVYNSLTDDEKRNCVIWAENYGEAGALTILGDKYGLPKPISRHGSFWLWGYQNDRASVWISMGNESESVNYVFEDVQLVKMITHPFSIGEENNIPLYICRKPKLNINDWWEDFRPYIFD